MLTTNNPQYFLSALAQSGCQMKLHEHESADIFAGFGIRVPERILAATPDEAVIAAEKIGLPVVVKAQVRQAAADLPAE